eukprot:365963-Chlamydomonas_euryale.AAC.7
MTPGSWAAGPQSPEHRPRRTPLTSSASKPWVLMGGDPSVHLALQHARSMYVRVKEGRLAVPLALSSAVSTCCYPQEMLLKAELTGCTHVCV